MAEIKAVIFDWGGVLIDDPEPGLMQYCAEAFGVRKEKYIKTHKEFWADFQTGSITEDVFWERVCGELKVVAPKGFSLWGRAFEAVYRPKEDMFALASLLRRNGYKTALLSNAETATVEYFHRQGYDMFDALVFSCVEGAMKPERRIYERTLERLGVRASETVFIDDRLTCIEGAKQAGLKVIYFQSVTQVKAALAQLDVEIS
jgi:epoxide hydrolase-like predicted phosphatase